MRTEQELKPLHTVGTRELLWVTAAEPSDRVGGDLSCTFKLYGMVTFCVCLSCGCVVHARKAWFWPSVREFPVQTSKCVFDLDSSRLHL